MRPRRKTFKSTFLNREKGKLFRGEEEKRTICGETKAAFLPPKTFIDPFYHFSPGLLHIFPSLFFLPLCAPRSQLPYSQRIQASAPILSPKMIKRRVHDANGRTSRDAPPHPTSGGLAIRGRDKEERER